MESPIAGMIIAGLTLMLVGPISKLSPYESVREGGKRIGPRLQRWGVGLWIAALVLWAMGHL